MKNISNLLQLLNNLKYIKRTGPTLFAGMPTGDTESIAEHSYKVTYLTLLFAQKVSKVNLEHLLVHAITHDWAESIIGDIPTGSPSYQSYFTDDIRKIIKDNEKEIHTELLDEVDITLPELTKTETAIIELAELVAKVLELVDYKQKGHTHRWITQMFEAQIHLIKNLEFEFIPQLIEQLRELFDTGMDNTHLTRATRKN